MTREELIEAAKTKVIKILADNSVKIRFNEINREEFIFDKKEVRNSIYNSQYKDSFLKPQIKIQINENTQKIYGIVIELNYDEFGERGKQIKKKHSNLLNYYNVRVFDHKIRFRFSVKELEIESISHEDENIAPIEIVMRKIEKLLALSESDNEHESISASLKAQQLLKKYNLDIEQVTGKEKEENIIKCVADVKAGQKWKYQLAEVVAKNYCCKVYYVGGTHLIFYGYKSDATIARRVFMYLFEVGNRLGKSYEREEKKHYDSTVGVYNSYCVGFTAGVRKQLEKQCTALALVVPDKVKTGYEELTKGFREVNSKINPVNVSAYDAGLVDGQSALNSTFIGEDQDQHDF